MIKLKMATNMTTDQGPDRNGTVWTIDQKLDQPMDEEARKLKNMYTEKVYLFLVLGDLFLLVFHPFEIPIKVKLMIPGKMFTSKALDFSHNMGNRQNGYYRYRRDCCNIVVCLCSG